MFSGFATIVSLAGAYSIAQLIVRATVNITRELEYVTVEQKIPPFPNFNVDEDRLRTQLAAN